MSVVFKLLDKTKLKFLERLEKNVISDIRNTLVNTAIEIRNKIITGMRNTTRTSWFYIRQKGKKVHHPSTPGAYPAIDSGELVSDFNIIRKKYSVEVGTNKPYAEILEDPDRLNRPFMAPTIEEIIPGFTSDIHGNIIKNIKG